MRPKKTWEAGIVGQTSIGTGTGGVLHRAVLMNSAASARKLEQGWSTTRTLGFLARQRWLHGKGSEPLCQTAGPTITPSTGKEIPSTLNCPLWFAGRCQNVLQPWKWLAPLSRRIQTRGHALWSEVSHIHLTTWKEKVKKYGVQRWAPIEAAKESLSWSADRWAEAARVAWSQLPAAPVFAAATRGSLEVTMLGGMGGESLS